MIDREKLAYSLWEKWYQGQANGRYRSSYERLGELPDDSQRGWLAIADYVIALSEDYKRACSASTINADLETIDLLTEASRRVDDLRGGAIAAALLRYALTKLGSPR